MRIVCGIPVCFVKNVPGEGQSGVRAARETESPHESGTKFDKSKSSQLHWSDWPENWRLQPVVISEPLLNLRRQTMSLPCL